MNCNKKFAYQDKKAALSAINLRTQGRSKVRHNRLPPGGLRAYHCPDCNFWHITRDV